jgi:hypothetical protein
MSALFADSLQLLNNDLTPHWVWNQSSKDRDYEQDATGHRLDRLDLYLAAPVA